LGQIWTKTNVASVNQ